MSGNDNLSRYKDALERLSSGTPMIKAKDSGFESVEIKTRVLYIKRVLETPNRIDAIEAGVISEMETQQCSAPKKGEVKIGEVALSQQHR